MAHGGVGDLIFLLLFVIALQLWFLPGLNFNGSGAWTEDKHTDDTTILMQTAGALFFWIGTFISGVKWDEFNGKFVGLAGFGTVIAIIIALFDCDGGFTPGVIYLYALVLFVASVHVFCFAPNTSVAYAERRKNWGFWADWLVDNYNCSRIDNISAALFGMGIYVMWNPFYLMKDHNLCRICGDGTPEHTLDWPLKAMLGHATETGLDEKQLGVSAFLNQAVYVLIKLNCLLMIFLACILSGVQWNPINGKMAGVGGFIAAIIMSIYTFISSMDHPVFKAPYLVAFSMALGSLIIFKFPTWDKMPDGAKSRPLLG